MKTLNIVESGFRATIEEQDDTIVWITHAMKGAGGDLALLLRGNAVCYASKNMDASGLVFGAEAQTQPPRLAEDVAKLVEKGVAVYFVEEDLADHGLAAGDCIDGLQGVSRSGLPGLFEGFDHIWNW